jgi:hypothetical protein
MTKNKKQTAFDQLFTLVIKKYENVEWVFQFNNDEHILLGRPKDDTKELILTIGNRSDSNILFSDGKGNTFKIFAREQTL